MRRRYEYKSRTLWEPGNVQSIVVNRHSKHLGASGKKDFSSALITRLFNYDFVAMFEQHSRNQVQCLLGTIYHNDLLRIANNSSRVPQMRADGLP